MAIGKNPKKSASRRRGSAEKVRNSRNNIARTRLTKGSPGRQSEPRDAPDALRGARPEPVRGRLERPRPEQEIDDVPFVRLEPVQLNSRDGADVQPVDVRRIDELPLPAPVLGDGAANQR